MADEKISIINFKDHRRLLNASNELVFKCRREGKFRLSWLEATETSIQDKNGDIEFEWSYWK